LKKLIITISLALFLTALPTFSQEGNASPKKADSSRQKATDEQKKQDLYSRWKKLKKENPAEAYQIAAEYFVSFPDDKTKKAQTLKKWLGDYEKSAKSKLPAANDGETASISNNSANTPAMTTADSTASAAGTWTIVVTTQQGDMHFTLNLAQDGKNLSGSVQSIYGKGTVSSGKIDGNLINLDLQADPLEVKLKGTIDDNKMKGTVTSNIPNIPELPFVGTRSK